MEKEKINYRKPILEFQCQSEGPSRKKKKNWEKWKKLSIE